MVGRDPSAPQNRLGMRVRVNHGAEIAVLEPPKRRRGSPTEVVRAVVIRDVSVTGASLVIEGEPSPVRGMIFHLVIDGRRGAVRVRWAVPREHGSDAESVVLCGIEFIDAHPAFMPRIYDWLDRQKAIGTSTMQG